MRWKRSERSEPKQIQQKTERWRSEQERERQSESAEMNWQKDSHAAKDQDRHGQRLMVCTWSVHKTKSSHKLIIWEFINLKRRRGIMVLRLSPRLRDSKPTRRSTIDRSTESAKSLDQSIELHSNWQTGSVDIANDDDDDGDGDGEEDGVRRAECRQQFVRRKD